MSLRINHNLSALNAHRNLMNTQNALAKSMQKLSSGFRINQGADDPAGLVISEQFRAQIAGLNRAIGNSEGSISMIQTAEGALNEISNLLISMRELAIHAANEGFNDADQLAADQAEIENALTTVDRIAANTQFGTKKLLDGSKDNIATITSANSSNLNIDESKLSSGTHSVTATKTADASSTLNTTTLGFSLANTDGDPLSLTESVHNIDVIQASDVAKKSSDTISVQDSFGNDLVLAATATVGTVSTGAVGTAIAANVGTYTFTVQYWNQDEGTTAAYTLNVGVALGDTSVDIAASMATEINKVTALAGKVTASSTAAGSINIHTVHEGAQYAVKTTASSSTATTAILAVGNSDARGTSDNQLDITATTAKAAGANNIITLTAGTYTSLQGVVDEVNVQLLADFGLAAGGAAGESDIQAVMGDSSHFTLQTRDEGSDYSITMGTIGTASGNIENFLGLAQDSIANKGTDAQISFDNYVNTVTSVEFGATTTATLGTAATGTTGRGTIDLVIDKATAGMNVGSALLDVTAAQFDVRLDGGPATVVSAGKDHTVFNADRSESLVVNYGLSSIGGTETISNVDRSLVFQIGANVGQTASIGMRGTSSTQLGKGIVGNMFASLSQIDVTTVQGAQDAQSVIDAAINEVSTSRGTLGSFQKNTLESNLRNLRIAAQNLTASESQIRDTDIALEMSEFTKNQILVQAGTSMLAQANQLPQIVLSLFG